MHKAGDALTVAYVWQQRLAANRDDQCVIVADDNTSIIGFVCVYGREDSNWGALIDNLHVAEGFHRQGIGTTLMQHAFQWLNTCFPNDPVYLWVMENNYPARKFYEQLGAMQAELVDKPNPAGDGSAMNCRYTWEKAVICPVSR